MPDVSEPTGSLTSGMKFMRMIKNFLTFTIVLIALGAALYTQRVVILDWYVEMSKPTLPEAVSFEETTDPVIARSLPVVDEAISNDEEDSVDEEVQVESEFDDDAEATPLQPEADPPLVENPRKQEEGETLADEDDQVAVEVPVVLPASINLAVPFTPQAPHANWDYPYKEACEEASVYMVSQYYEGVDEGLIDADVADEEMLKIVAFEEGLFGYYEDTTVDQTGIFAELMYGFSVETIQNPTVDDIKQQLAQGRPVIVPAAGRLLGNPYFTAPGPIYHMVVIRGYTEDDQFIVNDPGTKRGEAYLYDFDTLMSAMHDWNGGEEITEGQKTVLVLYQ
jgi:hypothetical protein